MFGIYLINKGMVYKPDQGLIKAEIIAEKSGEDIGENPWRIFTALRLEDGLELVISPVNGEIIDRFISSAIDPRQDVSVMYEQFMLASSSRSEFDDTESHIFNASNCRENGPIPNLIFICDRKQVSYGWIKDSNTEPFNAEYQGTLLERFKSPQLTS